MSELRAWGEDIIKQLEDFIFVVNGRAHINPEAISRIIEAFAKEQRIKGMEVVRSEILRRNDILDGRLEGCDGDDWVELNATISSYCVIMAWIDKEIDKLKEGK